MFQCMKCNEMVGDNVKPVLFAGIILRRMR